MVKNTGIQYFEQKYSDGGEDDRLVRSLHGRLEYRTTMEYIHKFAKPNAKIIEIGAATGRYSIALAKEGYSVTAVELLKVNYDILKKNSAGIKNIQTYQADALDLSQFADNSFDVVLSFGPMYHLFTKKDQEKAIDEALRIAKKGAIVMFAFLPMDSIIYNCYIDDTIGEGLKESFTADFKNTIHFKEQVFTGFDIDEFENFFAKRKVEKLKIVSTDGNLSTIEKLAGCQMSDENFELFCKYHLARCEKRELLGTSSHLLYICKKL